ncbi:MAG: hypothetical protein ACQET8_14735 [Bacillota bacterium]|jgi:hypothetical protein
MKKVIITCLLIFSFYNNPLTPNVSASEGMNDFKFSDKTTQNQKYFGYYMIDFYHKEILDAMRKQYKGQTIDGYNLPHWLKHDVVSITLLQHSATRTNTPIEYSYAFKVTLIPTTDDGATMLGTDTMYFKVEPGRFHMKNVPAHLPPVKLMKYEHNPAPKDNK